MGKPEGKIEDYLIRKARQNNCLCYKFTSPSVKGVPDRILIGHGKTAFIELKSESGHLSAIQEVRIQEMRDAGATVAVLYNKSQVDDFFAGFVSEKKTRNTRSEKERKQEKKRERESEREIKQEKRTAPNGAH